MNEFTVLQAVCFIGLAICANMALRCMWNIISLALTGKWHSHISVSKTSFLGNKGEVEATATEIKFDEKQQQAIDKIIQDRLGRERAKFGDYEQLKQFKTEYEKSQEAKTQEELVKQKRFEEAENTYKGKINEFGQKLTAKEQEIQDLKINFALTNEVSKQNGHTEEVIALIKSNTVLDQNGQVLIKSKDANGIDVNIPLMDGVKKFLNERPHLVKSNFKAGGGTGSGGTGTETGVGTGSGQGEDLSSLNAQLIEAINKGDGKRQQEIKTKIKAIRKF